MPASYATALAVLACGGGHDNENAPPPPDPAGASNPTPGSSGGFLNEDSGLGLGAGASGPVTAGAGGTSGAGSGSAPTGLGGTTAPHDQTSVGGASGGLDGPGGQALSPAADPPGGAPPASATTGGSTASQGEEGGSAGDAAGRSTGGEAGLSGGAAGTAGSAGDAGAVAPGLPVAFLASPTFVGNDNPAAPQVGVLRMQTDVPASGHATVSGGDEEWTVDLPSGTSFERPILGLKPDTTYSVTVTVSAGDNTLTAGPLEWTSPSLPEDFIPFEVTLSEPAQMEPGMTLFAVRDGWAMTRAPILVVDHQGTVRWYFMDPENRVQEDLRQLDNGHLFFGRDFCSLREIDWLGNVVGMWHADENPRGCDAPPGSIGVATTDFHHESLVMPNGNILVLSTETRTVAGYPTDEDDADAPTESALVLGSVIVEFTPEGEIVKKISLLDLLDPTRIGRDSLDTMWPSQHVQGGQRARDWDHANAVIYDEPSDSYYVSLRHQDAVLKVNRADETLTWILGTPANWQPPWSDKLLAPVGDLLWPFHQHAVEVNPLGLGVYDNGNYRAAAFENMDPAEPEFSRAVVYDIDEQAMTVTEAWSYGAPTGENSFFSTGMGDSDWQPATGNMLITNSELVIPPDDALGEDTTYTQILEVTADGTRVFELSTLGEPESAYPAYRAERIPDIRQ